LPAVLLSADLMIISAAQGAADRQGVNLAVAGGGEQAVELCSNDTALIVIDLRLPGLAIADFMPRARAAAPKVKVIAFGPHVHTQSLAAASEAGCDEVITRGEFERRIDGLMAALTASAAEPPARAQAE
jgi:CheY-like chemotaxis protein